MKKYIINPEEGKEEQISNIEKVRQIETQKTINTNLKGLQLQQI